MFIKALFVTLIEFYSSGIYRDQWSIKKDISHWSITDIRYKIPIYIYRNRNI